jgi:hypothetical protein
MWPASFGGRIRPPVLASMGTGRLKPCHRARDTQVDRWPRNANARLLRGAGHLYVGTLRGVGRIYQQTVIGTYAKVAFAKLYDRKTPITAAEILNDRVVPFYDEHSPHELRHAQKEPGRGDRAGVQRQAICMGVRPP